MLDYHGKKVIRHDGCADGFVTTTCFIPSLNMGIAVLTNTDVNAFYSALRAQIIDAYMELPYSNHSERLYKIVSANTKNENAEIKKLWKIAAKNPQTAMLIGDYVGKYRNEVYGEIEINRSDIVYPVPGDMKLVASFSHHKLYGELYSLGENDFLCNYSIATYGVKKISFVVKEGKVKSVIIRVNDFVDMMEYEFIKE